MNASSEAQIDVGSSGALERPRARGGRGCLTAALVGIPLACVLLAGLSFLSNIILPAHQLTNAQLNKLDKARLAEAIHLREALGDQLWPGWGQADIPVILYNEDYAFLVGYPDPPAGWIKVPENESRGSAWEAVPVDTFEGHIYYRQRLPDPQVTPQAFTVLVGERWVSSMPSREWMEIALGIDFKGNIPTFLQPILPYRLASRAFLSAAGGKDLYILNLLHEAFHAFEGMSNQTRLATAETMFQEYGNRYPWDNEEFRQSWQAELDLLAEAVQANSEAETLALARQFLAQRERRRENANLDDDLIAMENLKEWEEGLAKYTELSMWRLAASSPDYRPINAMSEDPGFKSYIGAERRWSQETGQIRRMAKDDGDGRFYYSGLAQAAMLDRLVPDWRNRALKEDVFLEDLLKEAVQTRSQ